MNTTAISQPFSNVLDARLAQRGSDLLQDTLALLEDVTPKLGFLFETLALHSNEQLAERYSADFLKQLTEEVGHQNGKLLETRFNLHFILFGLGLENRHVREAHGYITELPSHLSPGNFAQALEFVGRPMGSEPDDPELDESNIEYSGMPLF